MNKDLRQYLKVIKKLGPESYVEVKKKLKPKLEVCVIQQKLARLGRYPAIYCPQIAGSKLPLVTNLFGIYERWEQALNVPHQAMQAMGKAAILQEYQKRRYDMKPVKEVKASAAPVKEVILKGKDVDLGVLPITHHADLDSGRYITIGCMICKDPETGIPNVGVYRHEVKGKDKLGCMIIPANHGAYIARRYGELGKQMPVVIFVGHHPAVVLGAMTRGSLDMNELEVMGGLLGEPLEVTKAETVDLPVPAWAEVAIEGILDAPHMVTDGPFAEYQGYYGEANMPCWAIKVTAITMRKDAIYHDLDPAHREHISTTLLSHEASAFEAVKRSVPTVKAVHMQPFHLGFKIAAVSIHKRVPGEARRAGLAAIDDPQVKVAVVVDDDIDVYNPDELLWAVGTRAVADRSISVIPEMLGPRLDPTSYNETRLDRGTMVTKVVIDATRPIDRPFSISITPPKDLWKSMKLEDYI